MPNLTDSQKRRLAALLKNPPNASGAGKAEDFILQYIYVEAALRMIGKFYKERPDAALTKSGFESLRLDVVGRSLAYCEIHIDSSTLDQLLNSQLKSRGDKSARSIRNGLIHEWNPRDFMEACNRHAEFSTKFSMVITEMQKAAETD